MTREERELSITYLEEIKEKYIEGEGYERHPLPEYYAIEMAIKALKQEPIDYKAQYEKFTKKAEIVISQLRADRDRLMSLTSATPQEPILDKIRAEVKALSPEPTAYDVVDGNPVKDAIWETIADVLQIIDKYR